MSTLDPRLEAIRVEYGLQRTDFWELPMKKGAWLIKHKALEEVVVKAGIVFEPPQIIEANAIDKVATIVVTGHRDTRTEWSFGEAAPGNCKNAYPFAMAEKRAKDRVVLKLAGLHGLLYSEDESDDFKAPEDNPEAYVPAKGGGYKNAVGYTNGEMNAAGKRRSIEDLTNDMQDVHTVLAFEKLKQAWSPILAQWRSSEEEIETSWRNLALDLFKAKREEIDASSERSTLEAG